MALNMRVARLTHDMVQAKPRGYWSKETLLKWLADQGFDPARPIAKGHNWKTKSFHFVQSQQ
jgi:hypothetical protein